MVPAVSGGCRVSPQSATKSQRLSDIFDNFFRGDFFAPAATTWVNLPLAMWEDEQNYVVEIDVPGVNENDVELNVHKDELHVRAERKSTGAEGRFDNRKYGTFEQRIQLPNHVDADKVNAKLNAGVLTISLPKSEAAKPRKIVVKAG